MFVQYYFYIYILKQKKPTSSINKITNWGGSDKGWGMFQLGNIDVWTNPLSSLNPQTMGFLI